MDKKKPCVSEETKTKYRCERCLKHLSSQQKLTAHMNKKNKCELFRHTPVIMSELEIKMKFESEREKMIEEMKLEYRKECLKIFKTVNNVAISIRHRKKLESKLKHNIELLNARKILPEDTPSIVSKKKLLKESETIENLAKYYKELRYRVIDAEKKIDSITDEQDDTILGINKILDNLSNDRKESIEIKSELLKLVDKHRFNQITKLNDE